MSALRRPAVRLVLILAVAGLVFGGAWRGRDEPSGQAAREAMPETARADVRTANAPGGDRPAPSPPPASPSPRGLVVFVEPPEAAVLDAALPAPARRVHYVRVNRDLVLGKPSPFWQPPGAGRLELSLPNGESVVIAIDDSVMLGADRFTSRGRIEGRPGSRALFAWNEGFLHATIEGATGGSFALRAATAELAQFYQVESGLVAPCGGERRPRFEPPVPRRSAGIGSPADSPAVSALVGRDNPQRAELHVLMLYTPAVLPTLSGASRASALLSAFDLQIARVNATFAASLITARVRLVRAAETDYDETRSAGNKVQDEALTALYRTDDGRMDEIHRLRDEAGADLVCLALNRGDFASSGLSFLLNEPGRNDNADYAFSVVHYGSLAGTNVLPHEFGHVLGCAHDRENAASGGGAYSFSYGYRLVGADGRQYHDIMAYPPGIELGYFSNPDLVAPPPVGVPLGIPEGLPGESDSALTIERNAFAAAAFRLQTQGPAAAGTLVNVATRAFVGTGDQVLIGGFVVQGNRPATMLIRAAGPALAAFGVRDALADPVLRIFAGQAVAAENDNWSVPANDGRAAAAGEIAGSAARVGAFPFVTGSADAAVLAVLPPGAYSAVMEGAGGATGTGLIEAYEAGAGESRIIALATRSYADRSGREIHGGFVVRGASGTTQRILIRVLGPSLAREPFHLAGTLDDPEMELRDAAGAVVLVNDDWSTGAEGGASPANDFKPLVVTYGERRIAATGHAPGNRREPCVLADLPPGSYTVVVRPFELRNADPDRDQPAKPGVGVVEVYEIDR